MIIKPFLVPKRWVHSGNLPLKRWSNKPYFGSDVAVYWEGDSRIICEVIAIAAVFMKIHQAGALTKPQSNTVQKVSLSFLFHRRRTGLRNMK